MSVPVLRLQTLKCLDCEHTMSASTYPALKDAYHAHVDYVNAALPRETDEHFAEHRLDRLMAQ